MRLAVNTLTGIDGERAWLQRRTFRVVHFNWKRVVCSWAQVFHSLWESKWSILGEVLLEDCTTSSVKGYYCEWSGIYTNWAHVGATCVVQVPRDIDGGGREHRHSDVCRACNIIQRHVTRRRYKGTDNSQACDPYAKENSNSIAVTVWAIASNSATKPKITSCSLKTTLQKRPRMRHQYVRIIIIITPDVFGSLHACCLVLTVSV